MLVLCPPQRTFGNVWRYFWLFKLGGSCYISWVETSDVESGYAFNMHLNAFYPSSIMLHVIQLFFINYVTLTDTLWGYLVENALRVIAVGYYIYVIFPG